MSFDPKQYWEARHNRTCALEGVGSEGRSQAWNDYFYKTKVRAFNKTLKKMGLNLTGCKVLDIGTGVGFWVDFLLQRGAAAIDGIDIAANAIEFCHKKYAVHQNVRFFKGDISDDVFASEAFSEKYDLVTAFDVFYHITDEPKFRKAIKNVSSVLKPGGYFFLSDVFAKLTLSPQEHVVWRSLSDYEGDLENCDLNRVSLTPVTFFLMPPVDASGFTRKILKVLYYGITVRFTLKTKNTSLFAKRYLAILNFLDSLITSLHPVRGFTKLLVAQKKLL